MGVNRLESVRGDMQLPTRLAHVGNTKGKHVGSGDTILLTAKEFALLWLLASAYSGLVLDPGPVAFQYVLTIAVYPCLAWVFAHGQRGILR